MVQSARVQKIVVGDDVVLNHQIMDDKAYNAELTRAPVTLGASDLVNCFYPGADATVIDTVGYPATPVGSSPTSTIQVAIPGTIDPIPPDTSAPRGSVAFQAGLGQTVRVEILRSVASLTGDLTTSQPLVANVSSFTGLVIGQQVLGAGVPKNAIIIAMDTVALTLTLSLQATATATGVSLKTYTKESHYLYDEVDILSRDFPVQPTTPNLNLT